MSTTKIATRQEINRRARRVPSAFLRTRPPVELPREKIDEQRAAAIREDEAEVNEFGITRAELLAIYRDAETTALRDASEEFAQSIYLASKNRSLQ